MRCAPCRCRVFNRAFRGVLFLFLGCCCECFRCAHHYLTIRTFTCVGIFVEFAHHVFRVLSFTDANEEALLSVELQTKEDRQLCLRQCTEVIQNEGTRFICIQTLLLIALSGGEYDARARVRRTLPPPKKKSACAERLHARFSLFQYSELRCLSFCRLVFIDFRLCSLLPSYRR